MFSTQKSAPHNSLATPTLSVENLLTKIKLEEPHSIELFNQIEKILKIFQFLTTKEKIIQTDIALSYEIKKIKTQALPQLLQKYQALPVDYRLKAKISAEQTAQQVLLAQLKNIEYVLVDILNSVLAEDKKEFLVQAQYVENNSQSSERQELDLAALPPTPAVLVDKLKQEVNNIQSSFVFYEQPDKNQENIGKQNKKIMFLVITVVVALASVSLLLL